MRNVSGTACGKHEFFGNKGTVFAINLQKKQGTLWECFLGAQTKAFVFQIFFTYSKERIFEIFLSSRKFSIKRKV
jgi:hypothetical protein